MSSDVAIARNLQNGRFGFLWSKNDVVFDDTLEHEVMSRLVEARAKWWADADGTHGSRLSTIGNVTAATASDAEAYAREALQGMVDANRVVVQSVRVDVPPQADGRFVVNVFYSAPGSQLVLSASATFV